MLQLILTVVGARPKLPAARDFLYSGNIRSSSLCPRVQKGIYFRYLGLRRLGNSGRAPTCASPPRICHNSAVAVPAAASATAAASPTAGRQPGAEPSHSIWVLVAAGKPTCASEASSLVATSAGDMFWSVIGTLGPYATRSRMTCGTGWVLANEGRCSSRSDSADSLGYCARHGLAGQRTSR